MPLIYGPENHKRKHWERQQREKKKKTGIKISTNINIDMHRLKNKTSHNSLNKSVKSSADVFVATEDEDTCGRGDAKALETSRMFRQTTVRRAVNLADVRLCGLGGVSYWCVVRLVLFEETKRSRAGRKT